MKIVLVFPVNYAAFGVAGPHMQIFSTLCRMGHSTYPAIEGDVLRVVKELKPDFVLASVGIWGEEAHEVSKVCPLIYYSGDEVINFEQYLKAKPACIFSHARFWTQRFRENGVLSFHLPWAADELVYFPDRDNNEPELDVVFVGGSVYPKRWDAWSKLKSAGVTVNVWNTAQTRGLDFRTVRKIYSNAKIVLAPAYFDEAPANVLRTGYGIPCRVFEAAACRAFQLVRDWVDLERVFPEVITFHDLDEMVSKVKYYLDNSGEREKIADLCFKVFREKHTYKHRLEELISKIESEVLI